jgi:D-glycero-alpha-D-manno-heptose-7-phosphate kinase
MIITKTPFRISFVGGGSDNLLKHNFIGQVVSTTINKFIYVSINKKFDDQMRFSYSKTENVKEAKNLKHEMLRETLKYFKIKNGYEVNSVGDIPSAGSGLGSSSSFLIGLINCINKLKNLNLSKRKIAEIACHIEIKILKKPVGMQDQYIAAFGGFKHLKFFRNKVLIKKINISKTRLKLFEENLFMYYSNQTRKSKNILNQVKKKKNTSIIKKIAELANDFINELKFGDIDNIGKILDKNWELKKKLSDKSSSHTLNKIYDYAINVGASGGKLLGAGGGGFFLFYVPKYNQKNFKKKMSKYKRILFKFYNNPSTIINI